jgi:hypothetical protein
VTDTNTPTTGARDYTCAQGAWVGVGTGTCVTAVDGACGAAAGGSTLAPPSANLCSSGVATSVNGSGPYSWSCLGRDGGDSVNCTANRSCPTAPATWSSGNSGLCGAGLLEGAHGDSGFANDYQGSPKGHRSYTCGQGSWYPAETGYCASATISSTNWPNGASFAGLLSITYQFTVTGNPSVVECRIFKNGTTAPAFTPCSGSYTSAITEDDDTHWVFQLRVSDPYDGLFLLSRTFWNTSLN